jgi:hypothetical protein
MKMWPSYKTVKVDERVARFRKRSLKLMIEREQEIADGLEHLSPAALRDKERITEDER